MVYPSPNIAIDGNLPGSGIGGQPRNRLQKPVTALVYPCPARRAAGSPRVDKHGTCHDGKVVRKVGSSDTRRWVALDDSVVSDFLGDHVGRQRKRATSREFDEAFVVGVGRESSVRLHR